jgi:hypothetical protein
MREREEHLMAHIRENLPDFSPSWAIPLNNNSTFTLSGPSGVLGCTGQRRGAPLYGVVQTSTLNGRRLSRCAIERR